MACCEIRVTESGLYCCEIPHITVRTGCFVQIKSANLPETAVSMAVGEELAPTDYVVGGDSACTTIYKPGEYVLDFDCASLHATPAPEEGAISLCIEKCCPDDPAEFQNMLLQELLAGNSADEEQLAALQALCDKMEKLIVTSNDATALATLIEQMEAVCDKILASQEADAQSAEDTLAYLEDLKELLTCNPQTPQGVVTTAWN